MRFSEFAMKCYETFQSRNSVYCDAFVRMPNVALISFIIGKAYRVRELFKTFNTREKICDDLYDIANYCCMLAVKNHHARSFGEFMATCFLEYENEFKNLDAGQLVEKIIEFTGELCENDSVDALKKLVVLAYYLAVRIHPPSTFSTVRENVKKYV